MTLSTYLTRAILAAQYSATNPARFVRVVLRARECKGVIREAIKNAGL